MAPNPCPTGKKSFKNKTEAEREMFSFWRRCGRGKKMPTRVYKCQHELRPGYRHWHMTSTPLSDYQNRVAR